MAASSWGLVPCLAVALLASQASAQQAPLWVLDLRMKAEAPPDLGRPLRAVLYSDAPARLAARLPGVVSIHDDRLVLDLPPQALLSRGEPGEPPRATFVVDYDTEPLLALRERLVEQAGDAPGPEELVAFVRSTLEPALDRGFDVASQVATYRSGDCTEYAVLLAALARSVGRPARVVIGTVIVTRDSQVGAFGHAWAEIHHEGAWVLADATPLGDARPLSYLPESLLEDEGPGYLLGIASSLRSGILRIEVLGNAPAADPAP